MFETTRVYVRVIVSIIYNKPYLRKNYLFNSISNTELHYATSDSSVPLDLFYILALGTGFLVIFIKLRTILKHKITLKIK